MTVWRRRRRHVAATSAAAASTTATAAATVVEQIVIVRRIAIIVLLGHALRNRMVMMAGNAVDRQVPGVAGERRQRLQLRQAAAQAGRVQYQIVQHVHRAALHVRIAGQRIEILIVQHQFVRGHAVQQKRITVMRPVVQMMMMMVVMVQRMVQQMMRTAAGRLRRRRRCLCGTGCRRRRRIAVQLAAAPAGRIHK